MLYAAWWNKKNFMGFLLTKDMYLKLHVGPILPHELEPHEPADNLIKICK